MKRLFNALVVVTLVLTLLAGVIPASLAETQVQQVRIWTNDGTLQDLYNAAIAEYNATQARKRASKSSIRSSAAITMTCSRLRWPPARARKFTSLWAR
jgi:type II secretory pathway pseudopilin PulG